MENKEIKKRTLVSFKDIQIAYLIEGVDGVKRLTSERRNVAPLLRRAERELRSAGRKTETLSKYITENFGTGTRGRSVPVQGQERIYRAQKLNMGGAFLRLPLGPLGTEKGGRVKVKFEENKIIVQNIA